VLTLCAVFTLYLVAETELQRQLAAMPVRADTLRIRQRKQELERKIVDVEEAMKIFSRKKVFVKLDQ
jgi:hypothetical protein